MDKLATLTIRQILYLALATLSVLLGIFLVTASFFEMIPASDLSIVAVVLILCLVFLWILGRDELVRGSAGALLSERHAKRDESYRQALAAQALYEYYFKAAPIGIVAVTSEGLIETANPMFRQLIGNQDNDITGNDIWSCFAATDHKILELAFKVAREQGNADVIELQVQSWTDFVVAVYVGYVGTTSVSADRYVLHCIDITARKSLEQQFSQSQKMQAVGQLAGGVAHDFNNILTAIIGFCDLLMQRHLPGDPSFQDIQQIHQNSDRAAKLVGQLLAFSRQQKLVPQVINIAEALTNLSPLLTRLLGEYVQLVVDHSRDIWRVKVDPTQLDQVIMNLAVNARDAMTKGGILKIRTDNFTLNSPMPLRGDNVLPGQYLRVRVTDSGCGMPPEVVSRIFEPFYTTKGVGAGTGLGLSTVFGIMKQTGGHVLVDTAEGVGTTFTLLIPRYDGPMEASPAEKISGAVAVNESTTAGTGTILIVEDEDAVRLFTARALRNKGYQVLEARHGEAGFDIIKAGQHIDLMVTDVMMPEMDGATLIRLARDILPSLKIICMSGYAEESIRERLNSQENIRFLGKPFTLKQITALVKEVLG
ncbi:MAG: ATP-binding protein [Alphaproteobacteria bacterium]|jgi:two-component system cell cycle sensor histidine kinase/response regulator CckA|nr:ATP-binding protein [Alphaproteobacteria bacterium]